ncbi:hypothetical protein [uncultured Hoeflea sp.]|uniref:hypothetical protein n=1 Tax=uncultured Hoeflea sp. TaxID=538666 RepID=UPI0030DB1E53
MRRGRPEFTQKQCCFVGAKPLFDCKILQSGVKLLAFEQVKQSGAVYANTHYAAEALYCLENSFELATRISRMEMKRKTRERGNRDHNRAYFQNSHCSTPADIIAIVEVMVRQRNLSEAYAAIQTVA